MRTQAPDFWDDPKKAEQKMKNLKELKSWVNAYEDVKTAIEETSVLLEFFKEGEAEEADVDLQYKKTVKLIEDLELRNMLQKEEDKMGAILKNKCRSRRYRKPGLGRDAHADVCKMGRTPRLQGNGNQFPGRR